MIIIKASWMIKWYHTDAVIQIGGHINRHQSFLATTNVVVVLVLYSSSSCSIYIISSIYISSGIYISIIIIYISII